MKASCLFSRHLRALSRPVRHQQRGLLTLAIESSCDDTSVAVLEKHPNDSATLHFHEKITSDNRFYKGIRPIIAHESHQQELAGLVKKALQQLPEQRPAIAHLGNTLLIPTKHGAEMRQKPDFVTVTRGPGIRACLITGLDTAKALSVAWQVPFLGVNHMQAHALTPRLVSALDADTTDISISAKDPEFPFLSLLVSGGHTMLVHSRGLCDHEILASTTDAAIGNAIDKCARDILPPSILDSATDVMYGKTLEKFTFPEDTDYDYTPVFNRQGNFERVATNNELSFPVTLSRRPYDMVYSFSGVTPTAKRWLDSDKIRTDEERRALARDSMRVLFEHLASRVLLALKRPDVKAVKALVVSGGVASNQFLKHVLRRTLDVKGHESLRLIFPPPKYCTDNAAMIAWTGIEMWEAGWRTDLDVLTAHQWSIDPRAEDGGILGQKGWRRVE